MIFNINQKQWDNFWYYYRAHVIVGIFVLIVVAVTVKDCAQRVDPDVSWGYMGAELTSTHIEQLSQEFSDVLQDANHDGNIYALIRIMTIPQQIVAMMAAGDTQLFAFDLDTFTRFASVGAFQPLDELASASRLPFEHSPEVRVKAEGLSEEHIYGIPLDGNPVLKRIGILVEGKYLGVRVPKHPQNAADIVMYENAFAILTKLMDAYNAPE